MPPPRAIRVHVGDNEQPAFAFASARRDRIGRVGQPVERAFHPPLGHRLARMLARDQPHRRAALAHLDQVHVLPVERPAEHARAHAGRPRGARDQIVVPLHRIGREIGEPGAVAHRRMPDRQRCPVIARFGTAPRASIVRNARGIVPPTPWDRLLPRRCRSAASAGCPPPRSPGSETIAGTRTHDRARSPDPRRRPRRPDHDVAAIESGTDVNAHRCRGG